MWERSDLKRMAKDSLRANGYWGPFGTCLLVSLISSIFSYYQLQDQWQEFSYGYYYGYYQPTNSIVSWINLLFAIFISMPLAAGLARYFMNHRHRSVSTGETFSIFTTDYMNVVKVLFIRDITVFLWGLLFIIPGVIKSYQYYFVKYILAENPRIDSREAKELSKAMTDGIKFDIFMLDLSFFGWYLLGLMAFGLGMVFVVPYHNATTAELYAAVRTRAIEDDTQVNENGYIVDSTLTGF